LTAGNGARSLFSTGAEEIAVQLFRVVPALLLLGAAPRHNYIVDEGQSEVSASVAFFGLASKTAKFPRISGAITLSPDDPERVDLTVRIDATALSAPDSVTLARLKGPKFFDVARYPTVVFVGREMRMTGSRDAQIDGHITARGVTRPATLMVQFTAPPLGAGRGAPLTLKGRTAIDRRAFGMTAYPLIVGRKVTIHIRAVLVPA
jgi:polyisoprenoid-binding protein YceI